MSRAGFIGWAVMEDGGGGGRQQAEETWDEDYGAKFSGTVGGLRFEERPFGFAERTASDGIEG